MQKDRSFFVTGLLGALIVWPAAHFGGLRWLPFLQHLLDRPGAGGLVARIVLWFTVWVVLASIVRSFRLRGERNVLAVAGPVIDDIHDFAWVGDLDTYLKSAFRRGAQALADAREQLYSRSRLSASLQLIQDRLLDHNRSDRVSFLLATRSGLEASRAEGFYGLLRALVWAMPGLGFMGTALEMATAVGGMGTALQATRDYDGLKRLLAGEVIPHLAGAFDVTLFALGASVAGFLLLSLVHRSEEEVLLAGDELALRLIARLADEQPEAPAEQAAPEGLVETMEKLRSSLVVVGGEMSKLNAFVERSSTALHAIFNHSPATPFGSPIPRGFPGQPSSASGGLP
jgi:hypothetical protein